MEICCALHNFRVRHEPAPVETRNNVLPGNFARKMANDQLRKAA